MDTLPIALETKDLAGLLLFAGGTVFCTLLLLFRPILRDAALFALAVGTTFTGFADFDVFGAYWYRGTSRGFEITALDMVAIALLVAAVCTPRPGQRRWIWPASLGAMLVYLVFCTINAASSTPAIFGLYEVEKIARGIIFFVAAALHIRNDRDLRILIAGLAIATAAQGLQAFRQRLVYGEYRPPGFLFHPNSLSMFVCLTTPILIAAACSKIPGWLRALCWAGVAGACGGQLLTLSRAGLPIFACCCGGALAWCMSWKPSPGKLVIGCLAAITLAALTVRAWPLIMERYESATFEDEYLDNSKEGRGYYFRLANVILENRPNGVGLNNWSYWVSKEYGKQLGKQYMNYDDIVYAPPTDLLPSMLFAAPAHNLGVLTVGEMGWMGLAVLGLMWVRWLGVGVMFLFSRRPELTHRVGIGIFFGIVGVFLHSFTEWTFRQTQIYLGFCVLVGTLAALRAVRQAEKAAAREAAAAEDAGWTPEGEPVAAASVPAGTS